MSAGYHFICSGRWAGFAEPNPVWAARFRFLGFATLLVFGLVSGCKKRPPVVVPTGERPAAADSENHSGEGASALGWIQRADDAFAQDRYREAADLYQEALALNAAATDRIFFRLALCSILPSDGVEDVEKAQSWLERLIAERPDSDYAAQGGLLLTLIRQLATLRAENQEQSKRIDRLNSELQRLKEIDLRPPG